MQWHYFHNEQSVGPVSEADLKLLIESGALPQGVLVWKEGMPDWQPFSNVASPTQAPIPTQPAQLRIATAAPSAPQEPPVTLSAAEQTQHSDCEIAPIGLRIVAKLIDFAVLGVCLAVVAVVAEWGWSIVQQSGSNDKATMKFVGRVLIIVIGVLVGVFYKKTSETFGSSNARTGRRSPGKRLMKLSVVDTAGRPIGFSTKLARFVIQALMVGGLFVASLLLITAMTHASRLRPPPPTFGGGPHGPPSFHRRESVVGKFLLGVMVAFAVSQAGYAIALFNPQRRGLHDLLCNTRVIYRP